MPKHINAPTMGNSEVKDFYGSLWFPLSAFFLSTPSDPSVCSHSGSATLPEQIELGFTESPATNFTKSLQLFWNILEHFGDRVQNSSNTFPNLSEPRHPRHNKIPALTSHISQNLPFSACPALVTPSRMSGAVYELSAKLRSWCSSGDFEGGNEKLASEVRKPHVKLVKVVNSPNAEMARPAFPNGILQGAESRDLDHPWPKPEPWLWRYTATSYKMLQGAAMHQPGGSSLCMGTSALKSVATLLQLSYFPFNLADSDTF